MSESNETTELRAQLFYSQKNGYDRIDVKERLALEKYCEDYKAFLNNSRTEREAVMNAIEQAEANGFVPFVPGMNVKPGMKLYRSNRGKSLMLAVVGTKKLSEGCNIAAAHVDVQRFQRRRYVEGA